MSNVALRAILLGQLLVLALATHALAAGEITDIDPQEISQGDTALITIKGKELPQGSLVVEFYPQQIAVLDILASSDREIVVQVKVPNLAQPGFYNILLYNQLGIEVFRERALKVVSELFTPVFTGYSPKSFVEADTGFAVMLTGDLLSAEAVKLLSMDWSREGKELTGLDTTLALAGTGTMVAAVSGNPGSGKLRGTVRMGGRAIYLLEVEIYQQGTDVFGVSPASVNGNADWIALTILGQGLTNLSSDSLQMHLASGKRKYSASSSAVLSDSTAQCSFAGPLDPGTYAFSVERNGLLLYTSDLTITWEERLEVDPGMMPIAEEPGEGAELTGEVFEPVNTTNTQQIPQANSSDADALIEGLSIMEIPAGNDPVRIDLVGQGLTQATFDSLAFNMVIGGQQAEQVLATSLGGQYSVIFSPKLGAWEAGQTAEFTASKSDSGEAVYKTSLPVVDLNAPQPFSEPVTGNEVWEVSSVVVEPAVDAQRLLVTFKGFTGDSADGFSGSYSLLPQASGIENVLANISTEGDLSYDINPQGQLVATADGLFVSGSLLVRTRFDSGPQELSVAQLETELPRARLISPSDLSVQVDANGAGARPAILSWSVDFAPFIPADTALASLSFEGTSGPAALITPYLDETRLSFSVNTSSLISGAGPPQSLTCRFTSDYNLKWDREPVDVLSFAEVDPAHPGLEIEFGDANVVVNNDGFDLTLLPSGELPDLGQWSNVKLNSDNTQLSEKINGFMVSAQEQELFGRRGVVLRFRRNRSIVPDAEYDPLVASLCTANQVLITLTWAELGAEQTGWFNFSRAAQ